MVQQPLYTFTTMKVSHYNNIYIYTVVDDKVYIVCSTVKIIPLSQVKMSRPDSALMINR